MSGSEAHDLILAKAQWMRTILPSIRRRPAVDWRLLEGGVGLMPFPRPQVVFVKNRSRVCRLNLPLEVLQISKAAAAEIDSCQKVKAGIMKQSIFRGTATARQQTGMSTVAASQSSLIERIGPHCEMLDSLRISKHTQGRAISQKVMFGSIFSWFF